MTEQTKHQKKKIDAKEFLEALEQLPEEDKFILFHMVRGIKLVNESKKDRPVA